MQKKLDVIGFDINKAKIETYKSGIDPTNEIGDKGVKYSTVYFTSNETKLRECKFHIVAVPTPTNDDKTPDLKPVEGSSVILGRNLTKGSIVVYESTVYPSVTEEICVPILERESGLKCGQDFKITYSPERINSGDKAHRLENCQRDVMISFVNELSMIFNKMKIDTKAVIDAAGSKWNFIKMNPGLIGGHCIGVDPYYLIHRARKYV